MGISSDIFISKEKAQKMVKQKLLGQQESLIDAVIASNLNTSSKEELLAQQTILVEQAVAGMESWNLSSILNDGSEELYFYNVSDENEDSDT